MCLMAILYKEAQDSPVLLAANREEAFDRPTVPPKIQSGMPRVICGVDQQAGGTWLGVNQYGMVATVANRRKRMLPPEPRSRGLLCRELLNFRTAREAAAYAAEQLTTGQYAGANYVVLDRDFGAVIYGGDQVAIIPLTPGLHTLGSGPLNDPLDERQQFLRRTLTLQKLDSSVTFLAVASRAFTRKPDSYGRRGVVLTGSEFGTVSSSLISMPARIQQAIFQHAPGPPADTPYDDLSALLRQVLSTERSRRRAQEERDRKKREKEEAEAAADGQKPTPKEPTTKKSGSRKPSKTTAKKAASKKASPKKKSSAKKTATKNTKATKKSKPAKPKSKTTAKKSTAKKAAAKKKSAAKKTTKKKTAKKKHTSPRKKK